MGEASSEQLDMTSSEVVVWEIEGSVNVTSCCESPITSSCDEPPVGCVSVSSIQIVVKTYVSSVADSFYACTRVVQLTDTSPSIREGTVVNSSSKPT